MPLSFSTINHPINHRYSPDNTKDNPPNKTNFQPTINSSKIKLNISSTSKSSINNNALDCSHNRKMFYPQDKRSYSRMYGLTMSNQSKNLRRPSNK